MGIRRADLGDRDDVVRLRLAFIGEVRRTHIEDFEPEFVAATGAFIDRLIDQARFVTWLALPDGRDEPVGIASVIVNDAPPGPEELRTLEGYVVNVWVDPRHRRQGIARALMDAVLADAPTLGLRALYLRATDDGRPLYDALGFVPDPVRLDLRLPH